MKLALLVALLSGACAAGSDVGVTPGDAAGSGCMVILTFDPAQPIAGPDTKVRAIATVQNVFGVPTFNWTVARNGTPLAFDPAQADNSQITFAATTAGVVHVEVGVGGGAFCPNEAVDLNVLADGDVASYRLRVNAPPAPPQEHTLAFPSGTTAYTYGDFALDPGIAVSGVVRDAAQTPVPAYLRFVPHGRPDAYVETFSDPTGHFAASVLDEPHDVLVIPMLAGYVPKLVTDWAVGTTVIAVDAGTPASGVVTGPGGAGLVGASVTLTLDGVPSTSTLTTAGGAFTLAYHPNPGAVVGIDVLPPTASGLPRLAASSAALDPSTAIAIAYAAALAPRDLAGVVITRAGSPLANTRLTVAGTIGVAGTVTAGGTASATGTIRASATTNASGVLPTLRAANAPVSVVVEPAADDVAVIAVNLASAPPATLVAPAPTAHASNVGLGGVFVTAVPSGDLAIAGAQALATTSATNGDFSLKLAANATYTLKLRDAAGRGAPYEAPVTSATLPATLALPPAVKVTGTISETGIANPIANAAVSVLCKTCTGVARTRPIAEAASEQSGGFTVAVPDLP